MKKIILMIAILAISASGAFAAYTGSFNHVWDFSSDHRGSQ